MTSAPDTSCTCNGQRHFLPQFLTNTAPKHAESACRACSDTKEKTSNKTLNDQASIGCTFNALGLFKALKLDENYVKDDTVVRVDAARDFKKVVCFTSAVSSAMTDDLHRLQQHISKILSSKKKNQVYRMR